MFRVTKSIDIDFAHHVHGHSGPCINLHGHTWKFEVTAESLDLDNEGFVLDFKDLKKKVLEPCHDMFDHGLALWAQTFLTQKSGGDKFHRYPVAAGLEAVGKALVETRELVQCHPEQCTNRWYVHGNMNWKHSGELSIENNFSLNGAVDIDVGGTKVILFPVPPTSERIAKWLYDLATKELDGIATVVEAKVYETLHPVESVATFISGE